MSKKPKYYKTEEELQKAMGDKYHVCHKCSVCSTVEAREMCRRSQPLTLGDLENFAAGIIDALRGSA